MVVLGCFGAIPATRILYVSVGGQFHQGRLRPCRLAAFTLLSLSSRYIVIEVVRHLAENELHTIIEPVHRQ